MLIEAAALVMASVPQLSVAEALGVPGYRVADRLADDGYQPAILDRGVAGPGLAPLGARTAERALLPFLRTSVPVERVSRERLPTMSGMPLLRQLALLGAKELAGFRADHPAALRALVSTQPKPAAVTAWWGGLPSSAHRSLLSTLPELLGNLDGLPFAVRDQANRVFLADEIERQETVLRSGLGRSEHMRAQTRLVALERIRDALAGGDASGVAALVQLDVHAEPKAVVAVGDLDRADYVSYLVPGMFFGVQEQIGAWVATAVELHEEQVRWLELFEQAMAGPDRPSGAGAQTAVATVAWIGYQTPSLLNIGSLDLAEEGSDALANSVRGLAAARAGRPPHISVMAHSYGSTAALMALDDGGVTVDALAVLGSPGSPAESVADLNVRDGNVFVGEAEWDPIPQSAFFGADPGSRDFGAHRLSVSGGIDAITQRSLAPSIGHNAYFGPGTESLRNLALIGINRTHFVTDGSEADRERTLALLH